MNEPKFIALYAACAIAVILLAIGLCVGHWFRRRPPVSDYFIGGAVWAISVAIKIVLSLVVFGLWGAATQRDMPLVLSIFVTGLLTGVTECVLTFAVGKLTGLRFANWNSQVAFGLAFGCFEAALLGGLMGVGVVAGQFAEEIGEGLEEDLAETHSDPWRPLAFVWERSIAIPVHLLSSVLILRSAQSASAKLFWIGFAIKSAIDAVPAESLHPILLQTIYGVFGIATLVGFLSLRKARSESFTREASQA